MMYQLKALKLFICIIALSLKYVNCNDNAIQSKLRFKRYNKQEHVGMWYDMNHPPPLPINGSYHTNKVTLPEKAIYCTITPKRNADRFSFLLKYYSSISGKPVSYTNPIECIYPRSVEFPELGDKAPEPTLTAFERYEKAMWQYIANLHERSAKARRGEKTEPLGRFDAEYYANEMVKETFNDKPDPKDIVDDSSPNGIICERIKFIEPYTENLEIIRPICYPAPRPPRPPPPPTTPRPTITSALSDIYKTACYVLCHTGAIYQLLSCCRK